MKQYESICFEIISCKEEDILRTSLALTDQFSGEAEGIIFSEIIR